MINTFKQFFAMLSSFFAAAEKIGNSANNLAEWAEESTASIRDQARSQRQQQLLKAETQLTIAQAKAAQKVEEHTT